eukprot:593357-Pleurochrysis_carterae.AAC.3
MSSQALRRVLAHCWWPDENCIYTALAHGQVRQRLRAAPFVAAGLVGPCGSPVQARCGETRASAWRPAALATAAAAVVAAAHLLALW